MTPLAFQKEKKFERGKIKEKMNENLTNDEREMLLKLIQIRCINRKHIEGTPTEWVAIHDKIRNAIDDDSLDEPRGIQESEEEDNTGTL